MNQLWLWGDLWLSVFGKHSETAYICSNRLLEETFKVVCPVSVFCCVGHTTHSQDSLLFLRGLGSINQDP